MKTAVATSAVQVALADPNRSTLRFKNRDASDGKVPQRLAVGTSAGVTFATGRQIAPGDSLVITDSTAQSAWYVITSAGTPYLDVDDK
jgi:hypothetical protein